jgi:hypothetical protein
MRRFAVEPNYTRLVRQAGGERLKVALNYEHRRAAGLWRPRDGLRALKVLPGLSWDLVDEITTRLASRLPDN